MNAQAPEPNFLRDFLVVCAFLASLAVNLLTVLKVLRNSPQKREVSFTESYASREEVKYLRDDLNTFRQEARRDRDDILAAGEARSREIHQRIDTIMDELPWRIFSLLAPNGAMPPAQPPQDQN